MTKAETKAETETQTVRIARSNRTREQAWAMQMFWPKFAALFLLVIYPTVALTQLRDFDCVKPSTTQTEGVAILKRVQDTYQRVSTLKADFKQESYLASLELSESSSGQVLFLKPGQMKWTYSAPQEQVFTISRQTLWLYQKEENQIVISNFEDVVISDLPVSFLMGLGSLTGDFSLKTWCRNPEGTVMELLPKSSKLSRTTKKRDKEEGLKSLKLLVDQSLNLKGGYVTDVAGNITAITFVHPEFNPNLAPQNFDVKIPKGVDIDDRRQGKEPSLP